MPQAPKGLRPRRPSGRTVKAAREADYGRKWARIAKAYLREHPVCGCSAVKVWDGQRVLVVEMGKPGTFRPATLVDHVRPVTAGGKMWNPENLQPLCRTCHAAKTRRFG